MTEYPHRTQSLDKYAEMFELLQQREQHRDDPKALANLFNDYPQSFKKWFLRNTTKLQKKYTDRTPEQLLKSAYADWCDKGYKGELS